MMSTRANRVEQALTREHLRHHVGAIEQHGDQVILWLGSRGGVPVSSVRAAIRACREADAEYRAEIQRANV